MRDGQTKNDKQVKIELLSQWMLEAEFRKWEHVSVHLCPPANYLVFFPFAGFDLKGSGDKI